MKKTALVLMIFLTSLFAHSQQDKIKIGLLYRNIDTVFTHQYVDVLMPLNKQNPKPFNLVAYYKQGLKEYFSDSIFEFVQLEWPTEWRTFNFYNIARNPSKKCRLWMEKLKKTEGVDYIVFLDSDKQCETWLQLRNYQYKTGTYGVATYYSHLKWGTIFLLIEPSVYSTSPPLKFKFYAGDQRRLKYINTFKWPEKLRLKMVKNIPDSLFLRAVGSLKPVADRQVELVSETILRECSKLKQ
jgi:hypothetical protein